MKRRQGYRKAKLVFEKQSREEKESLSIIWGVGLRGDGIPAELFQILKNDAIKVLHSICQQIWKTQQWPQD